MIPPFNLSSFNHANLHSVEGTLAKTRLNIISTGPDFKTKNAQCVNHDKDYLEKQFTGKHRNNFENLILVCHIWKIIDLFALQKTY